MVSSYTGKELKKGNLPPPGFSVILKWEMVGLIRRVVASVFQPPDETDHELSDLPGMVTVRQRSGLVEEVNLRLIHGLADHLEEFQPQAIGL